MLKIEGKSKDLGDGFAVRRLIPGPQRKLVGPFIFFDHFGPVRFDPGKGLDVRPHPHIGLSTVTYLFEGMFRHRDSLGTVRDIGPRAVNWMTAGRGISHSERSPPELRASGHTVHGIQTWVALPKSHETMAPAFKHHPAGSIPSLKLEGGTARVIAGDMWDERSPVKFPHPIIFAEVNLEPGARLPMEAAWGERAIYIIAGDATLDGAPVAAHEMWVLDDGSEPVLEAVGKVHLMLCGGAPMDGPRHLKWNLVATDQALIDDAMAEWRADPFGGRWGRIPHEDEFIPAPE